ncbi:hypothetical protein NDU88_005078 [Pleurodeles waltl]|uniref:Endonuclease/exonuclease/phosphatase domain-containing protein n=1 Tax=Pleurodeles waltl TaxID=8319 RepID=A0AAV7W6U5_PLEWA|nr:hypothetical protein NDU88_005078 [Pleurodeles waltl]
MEDRSLGITESGVCCFKSTRKAEEFTDLLLNDQLRFVNGRTKADGAAKATFDNGRRSSVIDYVIVNVEALETILNIVVINRVESDHNPLVLSMRTSIMGKESTTRRAAGNYGCQIVPSTCRKRIRWDGEKYLRELLQLVYIVANYGPPVMDALTSDSPLILATHNKMISELKAL